MGAETGARVFPLSIGGEFEPGSTAPEGAVLEALRSALARERARNIVIDGGRLTFTGGIFRLVSNWNVLVPAGSGWIEYVPGPPRRVRYEFSCRQMLVCTTAMSVVMGVVGAKEWGFLPVFGAVWTWLFGLNYFLASFRLPAFVRASTLPK